MSLLFPDDQRVPADDPAEPAYFADLNLNQLVKRVQAGRFGRHAGAVLKRPLHSIDVVLHRQAVCRDMDTPEVARAFDRLEAHLDLMRSRQRAAAKSRSNTQADLWTLHAAQAYLHAVQDLSDDLGAAKLTSAGMATFAEHLRTYRTGPAHRQLVDKAGQLQERLDAIEVALLLQGAKITVGTFDDEQDYSSQVLATFERFQQSRAQEHEPNLSARADLDSVESAILAMVTQLYPAEFADLATFSTEHSQVLDPVIAAAEQDAAFYRGYLWYLRPIREGALPTCYPDPDAPRGTFAAEDTYDLVLADAAVGQDREVVTNQVALQQGERLLVVSGPNQGGKTTMARTIGQLFHLASVGLPVPGSSVTVFLPDRIFAHFERQEHLATDSGKLENEVRSIQQVMQEASGCSVVLLNEMFSSTTVLDATELSQRVLQQLRRLDATCVCVTFIDELSRLDQATVSMVSSVSPHDPAERTMRIQRRPADGRAYAVALAGKHQLGYDAVRERVGRPRVESAS